MTRRLAAIAFAIVLAALGAGGGLFLILSANRRAETQLTDPVTVLVATQDLTAGTPVAQLANQVMARRFPRSIVDASAVSDLTPYSGDTLLTAVRAGTLILKGDLGSADQATNGRVQLQVKTATPPGGGIIAGVDVIVFYSDRSTTITLLPRVRVNSVNSSSGNGLMVDVGVSQLDAERLIYAMNHGTLNIAVLAAGANPTTNAPGIGGLVPTAGTGGAAGSGG